jgi:hypothetical protein
VDSALNETHHDLRGNPIIHQTLRVTPAMEAGIANHVWTLEEIVNLLA